MAAKKNIGLWKNLKKFKGKLCVGNYEWNAKEKCWKFHLINSATGKTIARYRTYAYAKRDGWFKIK